MTSSIYKTIISLTNLMRPNKRNSQGGYANLKKRTKPSKICLSTYRNLSTIHERARNKEIYLMLTNLLTNLVCVFSSVMWGSAVTREEANTPLWQWRWRRRGLFTNHSIHFSRELVPFTFASCFFPKLELWVPALNKPKGFSVKQHWELMAVYTLMWTVTWMSLSFWGSAEIYYA